MTREQQLERAEAVLDHGHSIKVRLLQELDELEHNLRGMRQVVESMPPAGDGPPPSPQAGEQRAWWHLWNK